MVRAWRREAVRSPGGVSWRLVAGRADDRVRLNLGRVPEDAAEFARQRMQAEEEAGRAAQVIALHLKHPDVAVQGLLGQQGYDDLLPPPAKDFGAMTLAQYYDEVFEDKRKDPASPVGVSPSTFEAEAGYWRQKGGRRGDGPKNGILDGELGRMRLRDLDDQLWETWQESQTQLSPRAKVLRRNAYAALLGYARRMGHISYKPEFFRVKGSTKTRPKSDPLSLDEVKKLLEAALDGGKPISEGWDLSKEEFARIERDGWTRRAMWALAIGAGLRPGELVRVQWSDIDWGDQVLRVRGTKTEESAAVIPLTPFAFRELKLLAERLERKENSPDGPCFLIKGRAVGEFKNALRQDAAKAGIERHVTPYLLRHSFATLAWSLGVPQEVARRIMRHTDNKMLDRVYCRPRPQDLVARAAAFDLLPDAASSDA